MLYKTLEIADFIDLKEKDKVIVDLMENNGSHLKLVGLKKHQVIEPHISHSDVALYVTDGEIELKFSAKGNSTCHSCGCGLANESDEDSKKYNIKKGQLFFFEKNVSHSVEALKDSSFLLIKI